MKNQIADLNYSNFDEYLKDSVVLVDFWAEWCHPCKLQHKLIEEMAAENDHIFKVGKVNVDDNKVIASRLGVRNIPTLILYKNGEELRRIIGLQSKEMIMNQIITSITEKKAG